MLFFALDEKRLHNGIQKMKLLSENYLIISLKIICSICHGYVKKKKKSAFWSLIKDIFWILIPYLENLISQVESVKIQIKLIHHYW